MPPTKPEQHDPARLVTVSVVREALQNLYENIALANSELARCGLFVSTEVGALERAQILRGLLLEAIEELRPRQPIRGHAHPGGRSYEVLTLRYTAGYPVSDIADQLSVGARQIYRDLLSAEEEVVQVLLSHLSPDQAGSRGGHDLLQNEIAALTNVSQSADLVAALRNACALLQPLAEQKGITLDDLDDAEPTLVNLAPGILKEVLIQILSAVIQQCTAGEHLALHVTRQATQPNVVVRLNRHQLDVRQSLLHDALNAAQSLGLVIEFHEAHPNELTLSVAVLPRQPVLLIEDNAGVRALYERYLEGSRWRIVAVTQPPQVVDTAVTVQPAAIVLDILMSEVDGWSLLQILKSDPRLASTPVIVCSVISDPELARALGASASLTKPLSRLELLEALEQTTSVRNEA